MGKSMHILGVSAYYHDSAACLLKDGEIVAAAQENVFTRKKHDYAFPKNAVNYCIREAGINVSELDYVVFYDKPFVKFERILETYLAYTPQGIKSFIKAMPLWIRQKLWIPDIIEKELNYKGKVLFSGHHESHAASGFFSRLLFEQAAFLTIDGVGEMDDYIILESVKGIRVDIFGRNSRFPHSIGLLLFSIYLFYWFQGKLWRV